MKSLNTRSAGVLLHISSLPSQYGIGTLGEEAYRFVDFLKAARQSYWQILPLGPTSYGDSPYQSFSAFAGNPYFIDLEMLEKEQLISRTEIERFNFGNNRICIDYEKLFHSRYQILHQAYKRSSHKNECTYERFLDENHFWLDDYALFMALKEYFNNVQWQLWDEDIRKRKPDVITRYRALLQDKIEFWKFLQFKFYSQWDSLKTYANNNGIKIIGDIPIYVAMDSVETWANSELFEFDNDKNPTNVSGVGPDAFSKTGQLWGNPLYNWDYNKETDYAWWRQRMIQSAKHFDVIRIDHFIGFAKYYAVPANSISALTGVFRNGPGMDLMKVFGDSIPDFEIIAENLGVHLPEVDLLLMKTGYPGMKVLLFAFDGSPENDNLPHFYTRNMVVYTGTHDNETVRGFIENNHEECVNIMKYLGVNEIRDIVWGMIRLAYGCVANTAIIPMQDFLELSSEARMNTPATPGGNWVWRYRKEALTEELAKKISELVKIFGR
ncbi:MAG: 4-alpha-glucanotransferase [Saccharofermentanales bacterium]